MGCVGMFLSEGVKCLVSSLFFFSFNINKSRVVRSSCGKYPTHPITNACSDIHFFPICNFEVHVPSIVFFSSYPSKLISSFSLTQTRHLSSSSKSIFFLELCL